MDDSDLLAFAPVPLRGRRDGWTAPRQRQFVLALARGLKPGAAATAAGMSRKSAYALRRRPGAEDFTAAWDTALARAAEGRMAERRAARGRSLAERALHGEWHPRFEDGRLAGWVHRDGGARLLGLLRRLDRRAEQRPEGLTDAHLEALRSVLGDGR